MHNEIVTGKDLRLLRKELGLSQARFSEITQIDQKTLSAFELGKIILSTGHLHTINTAIEHLHEYKSITIRSKRYRQHRFNFTPDRSRQCAYQITSNNSSFLAELRDLTNYPEQRFSGVSLFSGIGGLSLGFSRAGCGIKGYVEIDDSLSEIYNKNFPEAYRLGKDITQINANQLKEFISANGPIDCVIGGPPCQGFSLSGKRNIEDSRNYLFEEYLRIIDSISPKVAVIENVRLLTSMRSKSGRFIKDEILDGFESHGYTAKLFQSNAKLYGVPQHRERVFFVATREDLHRPPSFPSPSFAESISLFDDTRQVRTFADACSDLPFLESGEKSGDPFHHAVSHPEHVIRWLWDVEQGASAHDNIDPELRPPSGYNTTYKRQVWLKPASTVQTTFGMISGCRNVHPIATRALTIREASRLQSFPDSFEFLGTLGTIRTGIGNAVPPILARRIAEHIAANFLDLIEIPSL